MIIHTALMEEAAEQMTNAQKLFSDTVDAIRTSSKNLLNGENWNGKARDKFNDTYRIIENSLLNDTGQLSNLVEIIKAFQKVYEETDAKAVVDLTEKAGENFGSDKSKG